VSSPLSLWKSPDSPLFLWETPGTPSPSGRLGGSERGAKARRAVGVRAVPSNHHSQVEIHTQRAARRTVAAAMKAYWDGAKLKPLVAEYRTTCMPMASAMKTAM